MATSEVFLDTSYAVALAIEDDQYHAAALRLLGEIAKGQRRIITTQAVLLEIGNSLSRQRFRSAAVQALSYFVTDPNVTVVGLTDELYFSAFRLFQSRPDKEWGMTDCVSFEVMRQRGIQEALAADQHFEQAGFKALLRSES